MELASIKQKCWRLPCTLLVYIVLLLATATAGATDSFQRCRNLALDNPDGPHQQHSRKQQHPPASSEQQQDVSSFQLLSHNVTDNIALLPGKGRTQITTTTTTTSSWNPLDEYRDRPCQQCAGRQDFLTQQQKFNDANFELRRRQDNKTHAVILLESAVMQDKIFSIAASLLTFGYPVTFVTGPAIPYDHLWIVDVIFQQIPCDRHPVASSLIGFKKIVVADASVFPCPAEMLDTSKNSPGDVILCSIQNSVPIAAALNAQLRTIFLPVVLIFDATSVAGLLVAERELIPAVVLVENGSSFLRHVLGTPGNQHLRADHARSVLSPGYWMSLVASGFQDRLNSIDLTNAFIQLNKIRTYLNMRRVRHVADLWRAGGSLMLVTDEFNLAWQDVLPNLLLMPSPLLPACIPCTDAPTVDVSNKTLPAIVVYLSFAHEDEGRLASRRLMQGLEIARQSIRALALEHDTCDDGGLTGSTLCWSGPNDFQIVPVPLASSSDPNILLPSFYAAPETQFLDSLARHQPLAIVSVCNATNAWIRKLGSPVLCLKSTWKPREIAFRLMSLWHSELIFNKRRSSQLSTPSSPEIDGMEWIVVLVEQIGMLKISASGRLWRNGWEMGRSVLDKATALGLVDASDECSEAESTSALHALALLLAWIILACATFYIPFRDASYLQKFRMRRLNQLRSYQGYSISSHINYVWLRLPELDRMWDQWGEWLSNQLSSWDENFVALDEKTANFSDVVEQNNTHARRKRNTTKKRH